MESTDATEESSMVSMTNSEREARRRKVGMFSRIAAVCPLMFLHFSADQKGMTARRNRSRIILPQRVLRELLEAGKTNSEGLTRDPARLPPAAACFGVQVKC